MQNTLQHQAHHVAERLKILSHPKRLLLLCLMAETEQSVGALAEQAGMREAAVSQQLMLLRTGGVVNVRREGQQAFYTLVDADMAAILQFLHARFCPPQVKKGKR